MSLLLSPGVRAQYSRRQFLATGLAVAGAAALPINQLAASTKKVYSRVSMTSSAGIKMLASYKTAITNLLALPATDPRNWYRNAFIHTLDCPHGNWWLLPWHRAYIGYFEQTCREFSGNSDFAFPFWDWTAAPSVPATFFNDVLDPTTLPYIQSLSAFQSEFTNPMSAFWNTLNSAQLAQMAARGINSMSDVWAQVVNNPMFFPAAQARPYVSASSPTLGASAQAAVSSSTIASALQQTTFVNFGSPQASSHEVQVGFGILEGQPHNNVHDSLGGFMQDFLSPVDPLFFMHHSNIDRLWTIWTAKQTANGLPTLPTGTALEAWSKEQFLFYVDSKGDQVGTTTAGNFKTAGSFSYSYGAGSNSSAATSVATSANVVGFRSEQPTTKATLSAAASSGAAAEFTLTSQIRSAVGAGLSLLAQITVDGTPHAHGFRFDVFLNPGATSNLVPGDSSFVASLLFVGVCHHEGPLAFTIPLIGHLPESEKNSVLSSSGALRLVIVPVSGREMVMTDGMSMATPQVVSVAVVAS